MSAAASLAPDRDQYVAEALPMVRSMLQLLDRDPLSHTYGCFDRQYWHFRTMDFPSGMSQEFALPLALAFKHPFPGNRFHQQERLREWTIAAVDFARRSAHADASCDDYYPYERALGAVVFSLYAMAEALRVVECDRDELIDFLVRRARWSSSHGESGVLTNHHAIAACALQSVAGLAGADDLAAGARAKIDEVLSHQHEEGWFREYEGFDPGYQTVTIDFLARYWKLSGDDRVMPALEKACALLERVQHPDGSFGGEYGSRNTYHCQPHGFEILAPRIATAGRIADRFLLALAAGKRAWNDDDRLQAHHVYPYLMAWLDWQPRLEPTPPAPPPERSVLTGCGFHLDRDASSFLVAGLKRGAPFRAYLGRELVANDSGLALRLEDGTVLVSHMAQDAEFEDSGDEVSSRSSFHVARRERMTPMKAIILRLVMLTIGRWFRDFVRRLLQRRLILGKDPAPFRFERRIRRDGGELVVSDVIRRDPGAPPVEGIWHTVGQTSIYIAASQPWQDGWLLPWTDRSSEAPRLNQEGEVRFVRRFPGTSDVGSAAGRAADALP